jgi:ABC-type multidrug transport system fused ATPase/permease subunit
MNQSALKAFWSMMTSAERRQILKTMLLVVASGVVDAVAFASLFPLIRILTTKSSGSNVVGNAAITSLLGTTDRGALVVRLGVIIALLFVMSTLLGWTVIRVQSRVSASIGETLSCELFEAYMTEPYLEHIAVNSTTKVQTILEYPANMSAQFMLGYLQIAQAVVTGGLTTLVLFLIGPGVVLVLAVFFAVTIMIYFRSITPRIRKMSAEMIDQARENAKTAYEGLGGLKAFRSLNATGPVLEQFEQGRHRSAKIAARLFAFYQLPQYYMQGTMLIGIGLLLGMMALLHPKNGTALVSLIVVAIFRLLPFLYGSMGSYAKILNSRLQVLEVASVLERAKTFTPDHSDPTPTTDIVLTRSLELRSMGFHYPERERAALDEISTVVTPGEFVGVVGQSGAGKSTLIDLLLGLLKPTTGSIEVDGQKLDGPLLSAWRSVVGFVPQEVFLIDGDVRQNIAFRRPTVVDDDMIWDALERAQLADDVRALPGGLSTMLGERGVRLSGGQRQRIGIARALIASPEVLILDEATSSLDSTTEAAVARTVAELGADLTRIVVAHRLSTLRGCDRLLLLSDGKLVGQGTFASLRAQSEEFNRMVELSNLDVMDDPSLDT